MFYWLMKHVFIGPLVRALYRPWIEGLENVPKDGPVILAANHNSFLDSIFLPLVVPRNVVFLGKSDYFDKWYMKWFFKGANVIPVRREGGEASEAALNAGVGALRQGLAVGIYPEGTRSPDGRLYRGKTGVARMALRVGCPIVPVAIIGSREAQPPDRKMPKICRVGLRFGRPMDLSRYAGKDDDRFVLRSVTDELMFEIMMLSGQEYVDEYAAKYKTQKAADEAKRPPSAGSQPPLRAVS
ncbi:MAG TPA: lysophospholipid acyltransferase family protein [Actinomycetota bacterium]|nr:lysophospholipid acyltransferase family protein [Actinomycetota bacterium]